jgi:signal transduction histidine kinase
VIGKVGEQNLHARLGPRLARWSGGLLLLVAGLACLVSPFLAIYQARQPFAGFLFEPTLVVSTMTRPSWNGQALVQAYPVRVVAVDGAAITTPAELNAHLPAPGTPVRYTVATPDNQEATYDVPTSLLPIADSVLLFWGPYFVAVVYLACGAWVFRSRRSEPPALACVVLCAAVALAMSLFFDAFTGHYLAPLWTAALPLCAAGAFHLGMVFPEPLPLVKRVPWLAALPYLPAIGFITWDQVAQSSASSPWSYIAVWRWIYLFVSLAAFFVLGSLLYAWRFSSNVPLRQRARSVLLGSLIAALPVALGFGAGALQLDFTPYSPLIFLALAAFPFNLAYAIARERLLDMDRVFARGLTYSLLTVLLLGLYIVLAGAIGWLAPGLLRADDPLTLAFLVILAALLVSPLQRRLRLLVDRLLYRERFNFRRVVQDFGSSVAQVIDLPDLSHLILQRIAETLHLDAASLYLFEPSSGTYLLYEALGPWRADEAPTFAETDSFIQSLEVAHGGVYRHQHKGAWLYNLPAEEVARVNRLHAIVFLPLTTKNHLVGWLNLGARLSGEGYSPEDLELLDALADRAATAIENARLFAERERRLTELAVLNEIGQAINSARSLEQVLETIYQETGRLMDTTNFYIALYDPQQDRVTFPLTIEDGQRAAWPPRRRGNGLTEYILQTQQPLLMAEQVGETVRSMGLDVHGEPARSWLGVPILHEGQASGVIAVQTTDPDSPYDVEDLSILSAIANQAAIAIENARLYELTDQALSCRLEEITVLADFAHTLATVALDPTQVAEQTLHRAVETLHASMGVLAHYDQRSQSFTPLVQFHWPLTGESQEAWLSLLPNLLTAEGGTLLCSAADLPGRPFPAENAPVHLLCPLVREDTLLAILHLALPLEAEADEDRRRFLHHLADHAAVALENALLYQKQVQQGEALDRRAQHLAEVLNLSNAIRANMQLDQVLQFVVETIHNTLDFGVALLSVRDEEEPDSLRSAAAVGFEQDTLRRLQAERLPLRAYETLMRDQLRVGHSFLVRAEELRPEEQAPGEGPPVPSFLTSPEWSRPCTLLIPLRGTADLVVGLLAVGDTSDGQLPGRDTIEILEIFANQAAAAIENARLYEALRKAYQTKGEFLSLVAHELQIPMGTLWGYADLLSAPSSEVDLDTLRGFVRVLKTNIARLDALVQDLLEVSRIEAGVLRLNRAPLDASEVVLDSAATFRPRIESKGLALTLNAPLGLPRVFADRDRLGQVVDNLISNAYKYTPAPGTIAVSTSILQSVADLNGAEPAQRVVQCPCLLITVQDSGIGLSRSEQKRLFTRFFRGEHAVVRQENGTGLGLYLVRLLVEAQGGQVWVESEPGQGSRFFVALPLAEAG